MIPLITCKVNFREHICEFVLGVNMFDLEFGMSKLTLSNNQSKATLVGSGHVSHRKTSLLYDHFNHSFIIFKNVKTELRIEKVFLRL